MKGVRIINRGVYYINRRAKNGNGGGFYKIRGNKKKQSEGYIIMDYNLFFNTELELSSHSHKENGLTIVEASPLSILQLAIA